MLASFSACFSDSTLRRSSKGPALGWPAPSASSCDTAAASGRKPRKARELRFISLSRKAKTVQPQKLLWRTSRRLLTPNCLSMPELKRILLVEDSKKDVELTLAALDQHRLANEVVVARDGAEALDYLRRRGKFRARPDECPAVVLLDLKLPKVDGLEVLQEMKA